MSQIWGVSTTIRPKFGVYFEVLRPRNAFVLALLRTKTALSGSSEPKFPYTSNSEKLIQSGRCCDEDAPRRRDRLSTTRTTVG